MFRQHLEERGSDVVPFGQESLFGKMESTPLNVDEPQLMDDR